MGAVLATQCWDCPGGPRMLELGPPRTCRLDLRLTAGAVATDGAPGRRRMRFLWPL